MSKKLNKIPKFVLDEAVIDMPKSILDLEFELTRGTFESTLLIDDKPAVIIIENENTRKIFKRLKESSVVEHTG